MIHLGRLRALCEVADRGTIAAAADALHLSPSAVSQQLAALEREIGQPLMEPDGRGIRLTAVARVLVRRADAIFGEVESLRAEISRGTADLRLGAFATSLTGIVAPALAELRGSAPDIRVQVVASEPPEAFDDLRRHELDLVISVEGPGGPAVDDPRITRVELAADPLLAVLPADAAPATLAEVPLQALRGERWVAPPTDELCGIVIRAACQSAGFSPNVVHHVRDFTAIAALVGAGLGVGLVPALAGIRSSDRAVVRPLTEPVPARHLFVACRRGAEHATTMQAVIQALVRRADRQHAGANPQCEHAAEAGALAR